jgi:AcrR family transcriptional regulator
VARRDELLKAAARVYARNGYRGSTTRRIADEAGVNEITIFRQFGTKEALIHEAIASYGGDESPVRLPEAPVDPLTELQHWAATIRAHITSNRALLRRCMSEREEHPQLITRANTGPVKAATELQRYLSALQQHGWADSPFDVKAAAAMFVGTLFADAMGRDVMPAIYPSTPVKAIEQYTRLLLRAIGVYVGSTDA